MKINYLVLGALLILIMLVNIQKNKKWYYENFDGYCELYQNGKCIKCNPRYEVTSSGKCIPQNIINCVKQKEDTCLKCAPDYQLHNNGYECILETKGTPNSINNPTWKEFGMEENYLILDADLENASKLENDFCEIMIDELIKRSSS